MSEEPSLEDLVHRWELAVGRGLDPTIGEICNDCPEMVALLDHELLARELARIGIDELGDAGRTPPRAAPDGLIAEAEPVPGHRLVGRIGRGGSGEVWEAIGPGGVPVAIKFVKVAEGPEASPTVRQRRLDSLRSLLLMRAVRHPNLLPLFGAWSRDGLLILVMELAERTLQDRFDEATGAGEPGLPAAELIAYMHQAASGIDFLNGGCPGPGVQHGDLKPQNLLLVGGCVKVGDFGQAIRPDDFGAVPASLTSSFAAPELSCGVMSAQSDQYALAVSYCLLRGGRLPFGGSSLEVMMGHFGEAPDLSMVPDDERPALARALAKDPAGRWPDCRSFVDAIARPRNVQEKPIPARPLGLAWLSVGRLPGLVRAALIAPAPLAALIATVALTSGSRDPVPPTARKPLQRLVVQGDPSATPVSPPLDPDVSRAIATFRTGGDPGRFIEPAAGEGVWPPPGHDLDSVAKAPPPPPPLSPPEPAPLPSKMSIPFAAPMPELSGEAPEIKDPPPAPEVETAPEVEASRPVTSPPSDARSNIGAKAGLPGVPPPIESVTELPPQMALTASITVLMPSTKAELVVKGEVGRGNPDEWYGQTRVIHSPPMDRAAEYIVGSFWLDEAGRPLTRSRKLRVEPGKAYEVNLRPGVPTAREIPKAIPTHVLTPGKMQ